MTFLGGAPVVKMGPTFFFGLFIKALKERGLVCHRIPQRRWGSVIPLI